MDASRVLIISGYTLFAEALTRLVQEAGCEVMARVGNLEQALPLLQEDVPLTLIVDHEDVRLRDAGWLPLLQQKNTVRRIIFLTLAGNEMIIHERRRVTHATGDELKRALGSSTPQQPDQV